MLSSNSMLTTVLAGGGATGVMAALAAESAPVPTALVAATLNVYAVPFVSPVITQGLAEHDWVAPPGAVVTV